MSRQELNDETVNPSAFYAIFCTIKYRCREHEKEGKPFASATNPGVEQAIEYIEN